MQQPPAQRATPFNKGDLGKIIPTLPTRGDRLFDRGDKNE